MLKLARYLKAYKKNVILGPIFKLIEAVFELIIPVVTAKIIDVGVKTGDTAYVFQMGGVMLLLGVVGLASALTCQRFALPMLPKDLVQPSGMKCLQKLTAFLMLKLTVLALHP